MCCRYGSSTHAVNTDQRRLELCGPLAGAACTPTSGNQYRVTIPSDPGIALPGYWMVFGVNNAGVPSVSQTVKIGTAPAAAITGASTARTAFAAPATATDASAAGDESNAAPIVVPQDVTPVAPAVPMPPGTQED